MVKSVTGFESDRTFVASFKRKILMLGGRISEFKESCKKEWDKTTYEIRNERAKTIYFLTG